MIAALLTVLGLSAGYAALLWWLSRPARCPSCGRGVADAAWTAHRARCGKPKTRVVLDPEAASRQGPRP